MKQVGIYSGTFDPVHNGHLGFALQSLDTANLDEVVFLPEKCPREKTDVTDITHRFSILQRAIEPFDRLNVRLIDVDRFCIQGTLPELRLMFGDAELNMLLGSDVVRTFTQRWADLDELFSNMRLVIGLRHGDTPKEIKKFLKSLNTKVKPRYLFVKSQIEAANSTRIRRGEAVRYINPIVSDYIRQHKLYDSVR